MFYRHTRSAAFIRATLAVYREGINAHLTAAITLGERSPAGLMMPNPSLLYTGRVHACSQMHEMVHIARELCGGQICVTPDSASFEHPETKPWMDKYYTINDEWVADDRRKLLAFAHLGAVYRNFDWDGPLAFVKDAADLSDNVLGGQTPVVGDPAVTKWFAAKALRSNTSLPFEQAQAMPPEVYSSHEFFEQELQQIFRKEWFCVGRIDGLAKPGDYVTCDLAGQPIAVARDGAGDLRAFSNVCLHRMSTLLHGRGNTKSIVCPYHAWTYNLDGSLRGAPAMSRNKGFCKNSYKLPKIRCEEWLGWVFVTLNPDSAPVAEQLSEVEDLIEDYDMTGYVESFYETHVWDTNWKVLAENFMESYHLPVCHAGTIGGMSKLEDVICSDGRPAFNFHTFFKDGSLPIAQAHRDNDRLKGDRRWTSFFTSGLPVSDDHADAGLFLVSVIASHWSGTGAHGFRWRYGA